MANLRPTRKPVFLWQAGLILLPVVIIAAVASRATIQSRAEVEREARQRAEEIARQYSKELERPWGLSLMRHDWYSQCWSDYLVKLASAGPGSPRHAQPEAQAARPPALDPQKELAEWQAQFPGLQAEEVFPDSFELTAEGRFRDGLEFNPAPQPAAWFRRLSPAQRAAWEALKSAAASGASVEEIGQRIMQFQETSPEPQAAANATFVGLRARLATLPAAEAVTEALRFLVPEVEPVYTDRSAAEAAMQALRSAQENRETLSEAGLPLANLAFAEALRYARRAGPSEELWEAIRNQVLRAPSPLIPALLDELEEIAGTNKTRQASVSAWRTLWNARLKLHDTAEAIRQTGKLRGITTTNLWIEHDQTRWLCILNPDISSALQAARGGSTGSTNEVWTEVRFLPKSVAEQALARALENSQVKLPAYLGLAAWLEGEPLGLPGRWSPGRGTNAALPMLAEANGGLLAPIKLHEAAGRPEIDYEDLPSRPRFVLRLYVADPALLFSSYRRHALLLAGLVAASAFGALIGVIASWRAFRRQLRLNELKSNFVSSVSHELRAPIASVRLMAESLERGKVPEVQKQQEYFRFIVQECRRLSSLIENVLDFSRIEQGRKQYDFEPTDLVALTQQTIQLMETYAAERGVKLQLQLADAINHQLPDYQLPQHQLSNYQLLADGKALQQALVNLIDNALKHSPKGDIVTVGLELEMPKSDQGENTQPPTSNIQQSSSTQPHASSATPHVSRFTFHASRITHNSSRFLLWVEDHGEGIPPSEQEKIFERFYRRGSELRRQTQGVGIGLSIVKHIVEAHGGRVLVRSAVGQGSRFTIELPLSATTAKPETRNPKPE
jgi:signal transduction histidine kinase